MTNVLNRRAETPAATQGIARLFTIFLTRHLRHVLVGCAVLALCTAPTIAAEPITPKKSEVEKPPAPAAAMTAPAAAVVMNPFTVNSDHDTGYQATNTLAGSRLNTPIKDLGSAISVYTKEFMEDIGATSVNDLLIYATGGESGGPGGNFSGGISNITDTTVVGDESRNDPQSATRVRGLSAPAFTRGFFVSDVSGDTYNAGALTVNRGPNAILFGSGSLSGVVDSSLSSADLRRNLNHVTFRYGDNDSLRQTLDLSRLLVRDTLGFRLAALNDRERFDQRPSFEKKERIFGALKFEPVRTTTLRGNFESGHTRANRPFSVLPLNSFAPWLAGGRAPFDWTFYDDPAHNPAAAAQAAGGNTPGSNPAQPFRGFFTGQQQTFDTLAFPVANPTRGNAVVGTGFRATQPTTNTTGAGSLVANAIRNQLFDPQFNRDSAGDGIGWYETRNIAEMPAAFFSDNRVPAGQKNQGFTDSVAFDWRRHQIDETGRQSDSFRNYTLTMEQRFWKDRLGFEASVFGERFERHNRNNFLSTQPNAIHIRIDPNVSLPDGRPNPNVGRPYVDSAQAIFNQNISERRARRATGFLRYDFYDLSPRWGRWLGRHIATGFMEQSQRDQINVQSKFGFFGQYDDAFGADPYAFNRLAKLIAYVGPSVIGNNNPVQLSAISMDPLANGTAVNSTFFEAPAGSPAQAKLVTIPYTLKSIFRNGNYSRQMVKGRNASLMSYWLADHVVTVYGVRRDEVYFNPFAIPTGNTPAGLENLFKTERSLRDFVLPDTPAFQAGKQVKSASIVFRWPQKLLRLPQGMDASAFINTSDNFSANGANTDAYGKLLPSAKGVTRETGLNLAFFNNRVSLRVNRYETRVADSNLGRSGALGAIVNNGVLQTIQSWATEVNRHPHASRQADIDYFLSVFPPGWADLNKIAYSGSAATQNLAMTFTQLPNYSDTSDRISRGTEFDLVVNPTRNWRMLVNFAKSEVIQNNIAPVTRELRARLQPVLDKLGKRPRFGSAAGYVFPVDPVTGQATSLDAGAGEADLASFFLNSVDVPLYNTLASEGISSPEIRKYRVNLVTNYTFTRESFLRGFGVGTGVRWQDKIGIGYPASYTATGAVYIDKPHPFFAPGETNVDGWASYGRKVYNKKIDWKIQLNLRNAIGSDHLIAITAQPNGSPSAVRISPDRRWYLTNTFSF